MILSTMKVLIPIVLGLLVVGSGISAVVMRKN